MPSAEGGSPPYFYGHTHTACDEVDVGGWCLTTNA